MSKFSFCKLIAWILIVFHCGLFSVVLGKNLQFCFQKFLHRKYFFTRNKHNIPNSRVQQRVKDAATTLWRQHSPSYDNNRRGRPGPTISRTLSAKDKDH
jgi:hypothetical protein